MKKLIKYCLCSFLSVLAFTACTSVDNFDMPGETFHGKVMIKGTDQLFQDAGFVVQIAELSYCDNPAPFNIPMKPDGTFMNSKLFPGHYSVEFKGDLPFWPVDPIEIDIKGNTSHDFEVVPYLMFKDVKYVQEGRDLRISFKMYAPKEEGMPKVMYVQPFTALANRTMTIKRYSEDLKQNLNIKNWSNAKDGEKTYEFLLKDVPANDYFIRVGVRLDKGSNNWISSRIEKNDKNGYLQIK